MGRLNSASPDNTSNTYKRVGDITGMSGSSVSNNSRTVAGTTTNASPRSIRTIDEMHNEMLKKFKINETEIIPALTAEISALKAQRNSAIDVRLDIADRVKQLCAQRQELIDSKKKYFIENAKYIFDYFEKKRDISIGTSVQNVSKVNSFFKIGTPEILATEDSTYSQSAQMYKTYWKNVSSDAVDHPSTSCAFDSCARCGVGEMVAQEDEGVLICNNRACGAFVSHIVDGYKQMNNDVPNEATYTAYIRLNHFKEILSQFQAKETTQIPQSVIDAIRVRIKKERLTEKDSLTYDKMREILRKLGFNKYFEHIQYINSLFGVKPPVMCAELHETLCVLFIEIQRPWAMHCPPHRTNFFNYTYTLFQLCVLLDQRQYLPFISQLKDIEKQREQDYTWQKVCKELDWEFYPTA